MDLYKEAGQLSERLESVVINGDDPWHVRARAALDLCDHGSLGEFLSWFKQNADGEVSLADSTRHDM